LDGNYREKSIGSEVREFENDIFDRFSHLYGVEFSFFVYHRTGGRARSYGEVMDNEYGGPA
jgi:hypothetical protein